MDASRSVTATPMWSIRVNMRRASLRLGRRLRVRRGQPRAAVVDLLDAAHDHVDLLALQRLLLQEPLGELLELLAVPRDEVVRGLLGLERELLLLLVADAARDVGDDVGVEDGARARGGGAHPVV